MKIGNFIRNYRENRIKNKRAFIIYGILRILIVITLIRTLLIGQYESAFICIACLLLFAIPPFFETTMKLRMPTLFQALIYCFIYASVILGEINDYYILIPGWDTILHTINGFLFAIVGFCLVDILNQNSKRSYLSPIYLSVVAFCFSMTVGVIWEFIEYISDIWLNVDMQKDSVIDTFGTIHLNDSGEPLVLSDITRTTITTASGDTHTVENGYLDIGLFDTMKDLFVNVIGATIFSIIGFFYVDRRDKRVADKFMNELLIRQNDDK